MHSIDAAIFTAFFLLNIIVGLRYRGKKGSFREYAIGDKKISTAVLTATIVATWLSGSFLFVALEETYRQGLYYIIAAVVGGTAGLLITGIVIGPRLGKFLNNVSVPASLRQLYGKHVQIIAGLGATFKGIGYIAIQFRVIDRILLVILGYESPWLSISAAGIIILYSISGGVKAVTFTDVVQFFTFGSLLPVLALAIWHHLQSPDQVVQLLQTDPRFSLKEVLQWSPELLGMLLFITYRITPGLPPQLFQRMAMASDLVQVKRSITYSAVICLAVELCIMWIAILALSDNATLEPKQLVPHIVQQYAYPGLKGLLGVGVIALAMSSADSALNSGAVLLANDVVAPLRNAQEGSLLTARFATVGIGTLALAVALQVKGLLKILFLSASFYMPTAVMPMLLAIFGFQTSRRVVLMAMGAGSAVVVACLTTFKSLNSFFPGMLANLVVMLGMHYLLGEKGGWGHNPIAPDPTAPRKT